MSLGVTICDLCSRNRWETTVVDGISVGTCDSFPDGIPVEIYVGGFDHRKKFGDEELLFELAPDADEVEVEETLELARDLLDE